MRKKAISFSVTIPLIILIIISTISPVFVLDVSAASTCKNCGRSHTKDVECSICSSCGLPFGPYHHEISSDGSKYLCQQCPLCKKPGYRTWHNYGKILKNPGAKTAYWFVCSTYGGLNDAAVPGINKVSEKKAEDAGKISVGELVMLEPTNGAFGATFAATEVAYDSLSLIGSILVFVYFLMELLDMSLNNNLSKEQLAKMFIKTLIGFLIIRNGFDILMMTINQSMSITQSIGSFTSFVNPSGTGTCYGATLQTSLITDNAGIIADHLIPAVVNFIAFGVVRLIVWTRLFDILIRMIFAPIGLSDFIRGGSKSNAVRYLKKFLASLLQGACIVATLASYSIIHDSVKNSLAGWMGSVLVGLAVITAMKQTGKIASEVIGD